LNSERVVTFAKGASLGRRASERRARERAESESEESEESEVGAAM
jgi:hypothetical protein